MMRYEWITLSDDPIDFDKLDFDSLNQFLLDEGVGDIENLYTQLRMGKKIISPNVSKFVAWCVARHVERKYPKGLADYAAMRIVFRVLWHTNFDKRKMESVVQGCMTDFGLQRRQIFSIMKKFKSHSRIVWLKGLMSAFTQKAPD